MLIRPLIFSCFIASYAGNPLLGLLQCPIGTLRCCDKLYRSDGSLIDLGGDLGLLGGVLNLVCDVLEDVAGSDCSGNRVRVCCLGGLVEDNGNKIVDGCRLLSLL